MTFLKRFQTASCLSAADFDFAIPRPRRKPERPSEKHFSDGLSGFHFVEAALSETSCPRRRERPFGVRAARARGANGYGMIKFRTKRADCFRRPARFSNAAPTKPKPPSLFPIFTSKP
ncbi:hypothetical protein HMPREF9120_02283 [Neisseria sp. oral taxon 020 str. F0370]|nr:hypothetical protein HMPREF9120_02283 [Neisseria sp. oral taxon 020 str. F0370]